MRLRDDVRVFGTLNPTDLRDYAGTQTLNKAFADRWIIWEKDFPDEEQLESMLERRHPDLGAEFRELVAKDLGRPVDELFSWIDPQPLGSASIAQTHRATTRDGDAVILKVVKPGIRETLNRDAVLLRVFFGGSRTPEMFDKGDEELEAIVRDELQQYVNENTPLLLEHDDRETQPTLGFQRVLQRALFCACHSLHS